MSSNRLRVYDGTTCSKANVRIDFMLVCRPAQGGWRVQINIPSDDGAAKIAGHIRMDDFANRSDWQHACLYAALQRLGIEPKTARTSGKWQVYDA